MSFIGKLFHYSINSSNRLSGDRTDFSIDIEQFPAEERFNSVCCLDFSMPKTYYLVNSTHNTFTVDELVPRVVTLTVGNYSFTSLRVELQAKLNATAPPGWSYTVLANNSTGKYTFSVTGNAGIQPDFIFATHDLAMIIGFERNTTNSFVADTLVSPNIVRIQLIDSILLIADFVDSPGNVLQEINVSASDLAKINFVQYDIPFNSRRLNTPIVKTCNFKLLNSFDGETIDLNGIDWSMTLVFYKKSPMQELMTKKIMIDNIADSLMNSIEMG